MSVSCRPARGEGSQSSRSADESIRRAARTMRRYAVANGLTTSLVLTSAVELSRVDLWSEFGNFRRRLRRMCSFMPPYLAVSEVGDRFFRAHLHLLVPQSVLEPAVGCWSIGKVLEPRLLTTSDDIRQMTGYMAKQFGLHPASSQRYRAASGYPVERVCLTGEGPPMQMLGEFERSSGVTASISFRSDWTVVANWEVTRSGLH